MLVGVSQKNDYGWSIQVVKFPNLESAEAWLNKEQYDFRDRYIFDDEEEATEHLKEIRSARWIKEALKDADTLTLLGNGEFDIEMSDSYIYKMMNR
jgi:hypothetical protein